MVQVGVADGFKLTREQEAVVRFRNGRLQIIACAGAGKTEAMSHRVAELIAEGVEPRQIVAFTFTERAARRSSTRRTRSRGRSLCG